jgi:hypothetical protein
MGVFRTCKDLTGQRFGTLTVIYRTDNAADGHTRWYCKCDCGNFKVAQSNNLKAGNVRSCGCLAQEKAAVLNLTHGLTKTKEFKAWDSMKQRCLNPKNPSYIHYGGRGITICDRWLLSFESFYVDMGLSPSINHSVDRIDVNGNYEPGNCKWSTAREQRLNQRPRQKTT